MPKKNERGNSLVPSGFVGYLEKVQNERGTPLETKKSKKNSHSAKKNRKGDSLVPSGFVGYLEKVKNERGTPCSKFALAGLGLRWFQRCS